MQKTTENTKKIVQNNMLSVGPPPQFGPGTNLDLQCLTNRTMMVLL
jgi:hypothetical protein